MRAWREGEKQQLSHTSCREQPVPTTGSNECPHSSPAQLALLSAQAAAAFSSPAAKPSKASQLAGGPLSEVGPSPLRRDADLQRWRCPGLPSLSKSSSQLDPCPLLVCPSSPAAPCQGWALRGSWLRPRAQWPVRAGGQAEAKSPCALPPRPCASFVWRSPAEMDLCFAAHTHLCILITIKTSQPVLVLFSCCFPDDGTCTVVE